MEKKRNIKVILIIGLIVLLVGVIGITFAFFSTGGVQGTANTFQSGCLNISLTNESTSINLSNIYPVTDIEGLDGTSYDFTIKNTCSTDANYQINLESVNEQSNSLNADYIKVSLSSNTVDNVISKLGDNASITPEVDGAYEAYKLYTGTLSASETKTYHLKLWLDYDATKEVAANKTYSSKINVVANPEITVTDNLEATFALNDKTLTSTLTNNVTSATYCTTTDNICNPTTSATISNNSYTVELESKEEDQMVCTKLNGTSKVICSNKMLIELQPASEIIADLVNTSDEVVLDEADNARYIGADPDNYVLFNCDDYNNPDISTCELWRIIGVFSDDTHGQNGEKLVKLIRDESIGNIAWDNKPSGIGSSTSSNGSNDWSDARLMMLLNPGYENPNGDVYAYEGSLYYNAKSGACYSGSNEETCDFTTTGLKNDTTRDMIETVTWKLGGTASYQSASNGLASHWYGYERGTTVYSNHEATWTGKIGLMYPSDYGYATSGGDTTDRTSCLAKELYNWDSSDYSDCKNNDWLYDSSAIQWTLTPNSSYSSNVVRVNNNGNLGVSSTNRGNGVRPSVYLKSNIAISGGEGTSGTPYTIK